MSHLCPFPVANPSIQYQSPETVSDKGYIFFRMFVSRPLPWSVGTKYNPYYDDANQVGILVDIMEDVDREIYEDLIRWIDGNIPTEAKSLSSRTAIAQWAGLSE